MTSLGKDRQNLSRRIWGVSPSQWYRALGSVLQWREQLWEPTPSLAINSIEADRPIPHAFGPADGDVQSDDATGEKRSGGFAFRTTSHLKPEPEAAGRPSFPAGLHFWNLNDS